MKISRIILITDKILILCTTMHSRHRAIDGTKVRYGHRSNGAPAHENGN